MTRPRASTVAEYVLPFLAGLAVPLLSAMAFVFFREAGSALVATDPSLTKAQHVALTGRIERIGQWATPALNAFLTAWTAYAVGSRNERCSARFPLLTAAGSSLSFLSLGLLFEISFAFWEGGMGLWYALGVPLGFAAGALGGLLGRRSRRRRRTLFGLLDAPGEGSGGVRDAIREYARFASVPAIFAVLDGGPLFWSDRRMERYRPALEEAGTLIGALPGSPGGVETVGLRHLPSDIRGSLTGCGIRSFACLRLSGPEASTPELIVLFFALPRILVRRDWQLRLLASQATLRLENARLVERARQSAVLEERQRLAREIHDTVAQDLIGIVVNLEALEREDGHDSSRREEAIRDAVGTARRGLQETRNLVWALRPLALEENPLPVALSRSLREWTARGGTPAELVVEGEPYRLRPDAEITLFRMLQEACSNVARHSRARHVWVSLRFFPTETHLSVRDDGVGMVERPDGREGFGLPAMRQRIEALGGELAIRSEGRTGTELEAVIPRMEGEDGRNTGSDR